MRLPHPLTSLIASVTVLIGSSTGRVDAQVAAVTLPNVAPLSQPGGRLDTLWRMGGTLDAGSLSIGGIVAIAADSNGQILIVDHIDHKVHVLDHTGRKIGTMGRLGEGPGEFTLPYRVAVAPDGVVYVYDLYQGRVSEFGKDLRFIRSITLQPMITVRQMIATDSTLVLAGTDRSGSTQGVIHEFVRRDGSHSRSFGKLLPARTARVAFDVGAGPIAVDRLGRVWYVTPGPYTIEAYAPSGALLLQATRTNDFVPRAEDAFIITATEGRIRTTVRRQLVIAAIWFGSEGHIYVGMIDVNGEQVLDEFRLAGSATQPEIVLIRSRRSPGPFLMPWAQVRKGYYALEGTDENHVSSVTLVRQRVTLPPR